MGRALTILGRLSCVSALAVFSACSGKPSPEATKPVQIATPPSERKAPPAAAPAAAPASPASPAAQAVELSPAEQAAKNAEAMAKFGAKMDQGSVIIRAKAVLDTRIDKFREDNGRWPRSLAEAGIGRIELPPGKKIQYNAATGQATITD